MERLPVPRDMEVVTPEQQAIREISDELFEWSDAEVFLIGNRIIRLHEYGLSTDG